MSLGIGRRYALYLLASAGLLAAFTLLAAGALAAHGLAALERDVLASVGAAQQGAEEDGLRRIADYMGGQLFNPLYRLQVRALTEEIARIGAWLPVRSFRVAGADGRVLADGTREIAGFGRRLEGPLPRSAPWVPVVSREPDGWQLWFAIRSGDVVAGWAHVAIGVTPAQLAQRRLSAEVTVLWARQRIQLLLLAGALIILTLGLGVLASERLSRTLARPLMEMSGAARRFAQGDLGHRLPVRSSDELGALAAALNTMAGDLERERAQAARLAEALGCRNAEIEKLARALSHELKGPLVTVRAYVGQVQADLERGASESIREDLRRVSDAAAGMYRLLDELRRLSALAGAPRQDGATGSAGERG